MTSELTYHVKAFAPDPRGGDNYFTYDGEISRNAPLNTGEQFNLLLEGLSDHVFNETGIRCQASSFVIESVQLHKTDANYAALGVPSS